MADLATLVAENRVVSAGKVAAIDFAQIKSRLGDKWDRVSGLMNAFLEAAIRNSMREGDVFFRASDLSYVVIYRGLSLKETRIKCAELSRFVCRQLFVEQNIEIGVRVVVAEIDTDLVRSHKGLEGAIEAALERLGTEMIIFGDAPKDRGDSRRGGGRTLELHFTREPKISFECFEEELSFAYRPIWDCARKVILTYLCQPIPPDEIATGFAVGSGFCTAAGDDEERARLDGVLLSHCGRRIEQMRMTGSRVLLGVPVHFSTLARTRAWERFHEVQMRFSADVLRDIVFVVFGLEGVPNIRIRQELPKLSLGRNVFCVTENDDAVGARFALTGAHAIGFELPANPSGDTALLSYVSWYSGEARQIGCDSLLLGVGTTSHALHAMASGVRYLEGKAIHSSMTDPRHAFIHDVEDLYLTRASGA